MLQSNEQALAIDETKLHAFMGKVVTDLGGAASGPLVVVGDRLGLYKAIAELGRVTSVELAERTSTTERYIREWLAQQAASGYVEYDAESERFFMTPEQIAVFADEDSPVYSIGGFYAIESVYADESKLSDAFRSGEGVAWGDHHTCLFCGTAKFFRPSYQTHLTEEWIPALDGVKEKLEGGAKVADVGCGHGVSTIIMAQTYPNSQFIGFDIHAPSIEHARDMAREAGVENVTFEVGTAQSYPGTGYDFVTFFDCLHDMGDPIGAAAHVRETLAEGGTWMIVEPMAADTLEENLNPVARLFYAFSTMVCTPSAMSQEGGLALGAQAGQARLQDVVRAGGFTEFKRAAETPFNMVLEARG